MSIEMSVSEDYSTVGASEDQTGISIPTVKCLVSRLVGQVPWGASCAGLPRSWVPTVDRTDRDYLRDLFLVSVLPVLVEEAEWLVRIVLEQDALRLGRCRPALERVNSLLDIISLRSRCLPSCPCGFWLDSLGGPPAL